MTTFRVAGKKYKTPDDMTRTELSAMREYHTIPVTVNVEPNNGDDTFQFNGEFPKSKYSDIQKPTYNLKKFASWVDRYGADVTNNKIKPGDDYVKAMWDDIDENKRVYFAGTDTYDGSSQEIIGEITSGSFDEGNMTIEFHGPSQLGGFSGKVSLHMEYSGGTGESTCYDAETGDQYSVGSINMYEDKTLNLWGIGTDIWIKFDGSTVYYYGEYSSFQHTDTVIGTVVEGSWDSGYVVVAFNGDEAVAGFTRTLTFSLDIPQKYWYGINEDESTGFDVSNWDEHDYSLKMIGMCSVQNVWLRFGV